MYNTGLLKFKKIHNKYGSLTPVEGGIDIPFDIKRVYYIYEVPEEIRRGFHSHNRLQQALICMKGSVKILVKTPIESQVVELNNPAEALYIGPMVWREMFDFSEDAVLLVLASLNYDESDYIRNYDMYLDAAKNYFGESQEASNSIK